MIRVECPSCQKALQAPEKYRGKKIKCPGCQEPLIVPTAPTPDEMPPVVVTSTYPGPAKSTGKPTSVLMYGLMGVVALVVVAGVMILLDANDANSIGHEYLVLEDAGKTVESPNPDWVPPFAYELVKHEEKEKLRRPLHVFEFRTTVAEAKKATKEALLDIWENDLATKVPSETYVYASFSVPTIGATSWGMIDRLPEEMFDFDSGWKVEVMINEYAVDPDPHHFVAEIDRNVTWQKTMAVSLPVANEIIESVSRFGFNVDTREVDFIAMRRNVGRSDIEITPNALTITGRLSLIPGSEKEFWSTVEAALRPLGLWEETRRKVRTVVGSPGYLAAEEKAANGFQEQWEIEDFTVSFSHHTKTWNVIRIYYNSESHRE